MPHRKKRRHDHQLPNTDLEFTTRQQRLRRQFTAEHVEQTWAGKLIIQPGRNIQERDLFAAQPSTVPANRDDIQWVPPSDTAKWTVRQCCDQRAKGTAMPVPDHVQVRQSTDCHSCIINNAACWYRYRPGARTV